MRVPVTTTSPDGWAAVSADDAVPIPAPKLKPIAVEQMRADFESRPDTKRCIAYLPFKDKRRRSMQRLRTLKMSVGKTVLVRGAEAPTQTLQIRSLPPKRLDRVCRCVRLPYGGIAHACIAYLSTATPGIASTVWVCAGADGACLAAG